MSYATVADIKKWLDDDELIQLTDDGDLGVIDYAVIETAISYADTVIDGYVGTRYSLPLTPSPAILASFGADIAICALYDRRPTGRPEQWQERCKNADKFLNMIATGKISLGAGDPDGTGAKDQVGVSGPDQLFPHSELDKY